MSGRADHRAFTFLVAFSIEYSVILVSYSKHQTQRGTGRGQSKFHYSLRYKELVSRVSFVLEIKKSTFFKPKYRKEGHDMFCVFTSCEKTSYLVEMWVNFHNITFQTECGLSRVLAFISLIWWNNDTLWCNLLRKKLKSEVLFWPSNLSYI